MDPDLLAHVNRPAALFNHLSLYAIIAVLSVSIPSFCNAREGVDELRGAAEPPAAAGGFTMAHAYSFTAEASRVAAVRAR
ncbi:hypothetical protein MRX96_016439 [Rhipicephalus microplus]